MGRFRPEIFSSLGEVLKRNRYQPVVFTRSRCAQSIQRAKTRVGIFFGRGWRDFVFLLNIANGSGGFSKVLPGVNIIAMAVYQNCFAYHLFMCTRSSKLRQVPVVTLVVRREKRRKIVCFWPTSPGPPTCGRFWDF